MHVVFVNCDDTVGDLAGALAARGFEVSNASGFAELMKEAVRSPVDALVLDPSPPGLDLPAFVRSLRSKPETVFIPILFLADRAAIDPFIQGFRIGSDAFVPKPVAAPALEGRITACVRVRRAAEKSVRTPPLSDDFSVPQSLTSLRGNLDHIGLPTLLTLFDIERKLGLLVLLYESPREKVRLHFIDGRLVRARIDGKENPRNAELIYSLLGRNGGKFDFRMVGVEFEDEIGKTTAQLLLEGALLLDERRRRSAMGESGSPK